MSTLIVKCKTQAEADEKAPGMLGQTVVVGTYRCQKCGHAHFNKISCPACGIVGLCNRAPIDPVTARVIDCRGQTEMIDLTNVRFDRHTTMDVLEGCGHSRRSQCQSSPNAWCNRVTKVIAGGLDTPVHPQWIRSLRDQCAAAGVEFEFVGWGQWVPYEHDAQPPFLVSQHGDYIDAHLLPENLTDLVGEELPGGWMMDVACDLYRRVGSDRSGRVLDGREWLAKEDASV